MAGVVDLSNNLSNSPVVNNELNKNETNELITENSFYSSLKDLSKFKLEKFLHNNTNRKTICIQGSFDNGQGPAIILIEKTAFSEDQFTNEKNFFTAEGDLKKIFDNDIYGNFEFLPEIDLNALKTTIIHPATDKHIEKYSSQPIYIINETPLVYTTITLPHLSEGQLDLKWVYNILERKSEVDRIVLEDNDSKIGFTLIPDLKWDGTLCTLYLLAIVRIRNLKSLRDLTAQHLPLLRNIEAKGIAVIKEKYNLDASQLRIYLHYQPSFFHLHVHFTYLKHEAPGITAERSHLLANVISNIELLSDYYQKVTLPFVVRETDKLFLRFVDQGLLTKVENV